ncbi:hypothetical protein HYQ46_008071 [Verticillium longisporum]|nr:hypothetical protein HYQ46_008071 [Verticillium longisporum]
MRLPSGCPKRCASIIGVRRDALGHDPLTQRRYAAGVVPLVGRARDGGVGGGDSDGSVAKGGRDALGLAGDGPQLEVRLVKGPDAGGVENHTEPRAGRFRRWIALSQNGYGAEGEGDDRRKGRRLHDDGLHQFLVGDQAPF